MDLDNQKFSGRKRHIAMGVVVLVILVSWLSIIDQKAEEYIDESTFQALGIFGTLRVANAATSVIKSVEVDAFVASVQFGQLLDPVDDLIEDASSVLKMAIGSLITQKILAEIVSTDFFKILISAAGLLLILSFYIREGRYSGFLLKTFALVGLTRFLFVLVIFLNGIVDQVFTNDKTQAQHQSLADASGSIAAIGQQVNQIDDQDPEIVEIQRQIDNLEVEKETLLRDISQAQSEVADVNSQLESAKAGLDELKDELDLRDRYFSENPEYEAQKAEVDRRERALSEAVARLDTSTERLDKTEEKLRSLNEELLGEGKGFFASAKEMLDFGQIQKKAEQLIDSTLNLMALLTLKSIIIPIVFAVLLLKGFRYIWGIDARTFAAQQWRGVQSELENQAYKAEPSAEVESKK